MYLKYPAYINSVFFAAPLHLSQGSNTGNKKNGFQVFCEDSSSSSSVLPAPSSSNRAPPSKKDNVENEMKAGVWTGARVSAFCYIFSKKNECDIVIQIYLLIIAV